MNHTAVEGCHNLYSVSIVLRAADMHLVQQCHVAVLFQALARAGLQQGDIDYWEINQAFSVVDLVNQQLLGLDPDR